jgi:hypothetical protein
MSEKTTVLAVHVHGDQGVEIEVGLEKVNMPIVTMIGILEQIKFDMLKSQNAQRTEMEKPEYDA